MERRFLSTLKTWLLLSGFNSSELPATGLNFKRSYLCCVLEKVWSLVTLKQVTTTRGRFGKFWKFWPLGIVGEHHQEHIVWGWKIKISCGLGKLFLWYNLHVDIWTVLVKAEPALGWKAKLQFCRRHWGISQQALAYEHSKPLFRELPITQVTL